MTASGGRVLNLRRWPRSSQVYRPTQVLEPFTFVNVLTTGAGNTSNAFAHSSTKSVLTTGAAHSTTLAAKAVSYAVLTTAAAYADASGVQAVVHNIAVLTTAGADAAIQSPGVGYLLDEDGFPILDEAGFPILISVDSFWKNSDQTVTVTGSVFIGTSTIPLLQIATAVLTTLGGHTATVESKASAAQIVVTGAAASTVGGLTHQATAVPVNTFGAADTRTTASHNVSTAAQTPAGAAAQTAAVHSAPTAAATYGAAHSTVGVGHEVSVAVRTTAAVHTFALLPAFNGVSVSIRTFGAAHSVSGYSKASTPTVNTSGAAASTVGPLTRESFVAARTFGAAHSDVDVASDTQTGVYTSAAVASFVGGLTHDVENVASTTFAAMSTQALSLHELLTTALTTGAAHSQWSQLLIQLCVEVFATADRVAITVECDHVDIEVEEC